MKYYPIALNMENRRVLVIGGGAVAERKVIALLKTLAQVRVISPDLTSRLNKLWLDGRITWLKRKVKMRDIEKVALVIAATSDHRTNEWVSRWARRKNILVNVVDHLRLCTFISPAVLLRGKATIAVYTDGRDPVLSRDLKDFLKEYWNEFVSYRNRL